jgi:hypothetical protein
METVKFKSWFQKMGSGLRAMRQDIRRTEDLLEQLDEKIFQQRNELKNSVQIYKESKTALGELQKMQGREERILKHKLRGYIQDNVHDAKELLTEFEKADF